MSALLKSEIGGFCDERIDLCATKKKLYGIRFEPPTNIIVFETIFPRTTVFREYFDREKTHTRAFSQKYGGVFRVKICFFFFPNESVNHRRKPSRFWGSLITYFLNSPQAVQQYIIIAEIVLLLCSLDLQAYYIMI